MARRAALWHGDGAMCGRYTLTKQDDLVADLEAALGESVQGEWWKPRFNIAPTQPAPVVLAGPATAKEFSHKARVDVVEPAANTTAGELVNTAGERPPMRRTIELMRWGLLPFWAGRAGGKPPLMINARVETIREKAVYRDALAHKRCLVPADGFFEWKRDGVGKSATKLPMYIHPEPRRTIAFAGLWARMRTDAGLVTSFTIVTGPPNTLVSPIHDRMPIVLDPSAWDTWLDPTVDAEAAHALLVVPSIAGWTVDSVGKGVNSAKNDDPSLIEPVAVEAPPPSKQGSLF
ncbi:MAG: SOS response-associated peptidase [Kofleriaceae bacterium]